MNRFSERLKELRIENGLTQLELSKERGISQAIISLYERNQRTATSDYLIGLSD